MHNSANSVMVITDDQAASSRVRAALGEPPDDSYTTIWARDLATALAHLSRGEVGAILLDLFLPDSQGIASFDKVFVSAQHIPILILEGSDDEDIARQAVQRGAKDRVLKEHIDQYSFPLVLRHILECATADDA